MKKAVLIVGGLLLAFIGAALKGASGGPGTLGIVCSLAGGIIFLTGLFTSNKPKN